VSTMTVDTKTKWTRERVVQAIRRWHEVYGEAPRAADWNPSSAKWSGQTWRIERYQKGDPETGAAWPSLNAAKRPFGGSLNRAIEAAGLPVAKPGPRPRRASASPDLVGRIEDPRARESIAALQATVRELERKLETRDRQLAEVRDSRDRAQELVRARRERLLESGWTAAAAPVSTGPPAERTVTKTEVKTKVVRDPSVDRELARLTRRLERLERQVAAAEAARDEAAAGAREAKTSATRLASRLERAEATINTLRAEKRELSGETKRALDDADALRIALERAEARAPEVRVERVEVMSANDQMVVDALARADRAEREAHDADLRAVRAEREHREVAALVTGEPRRLTKAEVQELRARGAAGMGVMSKAIQQLAAARKDGGREPLRAALTAVASAAIEWRERL
jgi:DNA repair exonuclease SbcCD ATPase subunit